MSKEMPMGGLVVMKSLLRPLAGVYLSGYVLGGFASAAYAHGASIELSQSAVEITATFDTGEPMTDAQVLIYSPTDPQTPWATGTTDEAGQFSFTPEEAKSGQWEITVRKAGHGHTTTFAVNEPTEGGTGVLLGQSAEGAPAQRWLSMAAIVWGFVGTALFFSRKTPSPVTQKQQTKEKETSGGQQ